METTLQLHANGFKTAYHRETLAYVFALPEFYMVLGNHEHKLLRYLQGHSVKVASGLQTTVKPSSA